MATGFSFDLERCTECQRCMMSCSIAKEGRVLFARSRISLEKRWPELPAFSICRFDDCVGKPCVDACPSGAISVGAGIVSIDEAACTGCGLCIEACPHGGIIMGGGVALKCDFCGGDPECVKACVTAALRKKGA